MGRNIYDFNNNISSVQLDELIAQEELSLLIQFANSSEMLKACEALSSIACTIKVPSTLNGDRTLKECKPHQKEFTKRERDVLSLLAKGYSYSEIASYLECKLSTVQTHVKNLYSKLDVHSKSEAIHEALCLGLLKILPYSWEDKRYNNSF